MLLLLACSPPADTCQSDTLFGRPNEKTGLTAEQCKPECCKNGSLYTAPDYTEADADTLLSWELLDPPEALLSDPYSEPTPSTDSSEVCGFVAENTTQYHLQIFKNSTEAEAAHITHTGPCGLCSSLADLAVYMRFPDLTAPVQDCGLQYFSGPEEDHIACLQALGFTYPCAQIWYYNTVHTREACGSVCLASIDAPYHNPDGSLNDCLLCDEEQSGPVFKAIAGRTRRNTGIASAMCRPCEEVQPLSHYYP
jgi:hypothetical protein